MTRSKDKRRRKNKGQVKELGKEMKGLAGQRTEELSVLKDIASVVNRPLALDQMVKAVIEAVLETVPSAQRVVIHLCSEAASILVPIASVQRDRSGKRIPSAEVIRTFARRAAKKKRRIHIPDLGKEAYILDQKGELSLLIIPLISEKTQLRFAAEQSQEAALNVCPRLGVAKEECMARGPGIGTRSAQKTRRQRRIKMKNVMTGTLPSHLQGCKILQEGQRVEFGIRHTPRGPEAMNVIELHKGAERAVDHPEHNPQVSRGQAHRAKKRPRGSDSARTKTGLFVYSYTIQSR